MLKSVHLSCLDSSHDWRFEIIITIIYMPNDIKLIRTTLIAIFNSMKIHSTLQLATLKSHVVCKFEFLLISIFFLLNSAIETDENLKRKVKKCKHPMENNVHIFTFILNNNNHFCSVKIHKSALVAVFCGLFALFPFLWIFFRVFPFLSF